MPAVAGPGGVFTPGRGRGDREATEGVHWRLYARGDAGRQTRLETATWPLCRREVAGRWTL